MSGPRTLERSAALLWLLRVLGLAFFILVVGWLLLSWFGAVDSPVCRVDPTYGPACD